MALPWNQHEQESSNMACNNVITCHIGLNRTCAERLYLKCWKSFEMLRRLDSRRSRMLSGGWGGLSVLLFKNYYNWMSNELKTGEVKWVKHLPPPHAIWNGMSLLTMSNSVRVQGVCMSAYLSVCLSVSLYICLLTCSQEFQMQDETNLTRVMVNSTGSKTKSTLIKGNFMAIPLRGLR